MESNDKKRIQELEAQLKQSQSQHVVDDEIDLRELWQAIWSGKWIIIAITTIFAIGSIVYALSQPNIYKASVLLAPTNSKGGTGGLSKLAGQFGGLASLAGINLGGGGADKTALALEVLKSRQFLEHFVKENDLSVPLIAVEKWDVSSDELVVDQELYDTQQNKWVRDVSFPQSIVPSSWETYEALKEIMSVSQDKETGMITIGIEYYSPDLAKDWLNKLVEKINETMRKQDKSEAQNSIDFLTKKLVQTELADMKNVFYQLIEEQTKTIMLAEASKEYVLKTIDPANVPDRKYKPKRALIVVLGTIIGGFFSLLIVLFRCFLKKES